MAADVVQTKNGVAMWRCMDTPRVTVYVVAHVYVCVCRRMFAHAIREINQPFQDTANSLITRTLYTS